MSRIPLPSLETMSAEQRRVYDQIVAGRRGRVRGPLRAALLNPELAERWSALGELLRYRTSLPPHLSELAIMVTGLHCRSPLEWNSHRVEAEKAGLSPQVGDALLAGQVPALTSDESLIYQYATELNRCHSVSDATYANALARFSAVALVELTALIGYYTMVAMTLNAHEIPLPEGTAAVFPLPQHADLTQPLQLG